MKEDLVPYSRTPLEGRRNWSRSFFLGAAFSLTLASALAASSSLLQVRTATPADIPSYVEWTPKTIAAASSGDALRGMMLARHCEHCHGTEGFSSVGSTPNLASMNNLALWKQLEDFQARKRPSRVMVPISQELSARDVADVVAYFSQFPVYRDLQDNRVFPQAQITGAHLETASRLISFGDGTRGIPPCDACHGPVAYKTGAPSLATQNRDYLLNQLEAFASGARANDINEAMRTIAALLSEDERQSLAEYYGAGFGSQPASASGSAPQQQR
jgi:cytochrome c553